MLGERLKPARIKAGLSQSEVAEKLGISQPAYSYIESGDKIPSLAVTKKLAIILGVSIDYLVGLNERR